MYRFHIIPFLIVLNSFCVYSKVKNSSDNYLPLVMINRNNQLELPNRIEETNINEYIGFIADTQFSKDESIDQMFFCPANTTTQLNNIEEANELMQSTYWLRMSYSNTKVSRNCLFRKTFAKDEALQCANDAKPTIDMVRVGEPSHEIIQTCGPSKRNILYKFVYEVCSPVKFFEWLKGYNPFNQSDFATFRRNMPFEYEQLTVYEICYKNSNDDDEGTIYTKHTLKSVDLLFDKRLEHEREKQHPMMTDGYKNFSIDFSILKIQYDQLSPKKERLLNMDVSDDEETSNPYVAEKLVSPDDMITALLRKLTFHYINVKPMHHRLEKLWNYIGEVIRKNFKNHKTENEIEIYTGAFKSSNPDHNLLKDSPVDIPKVWVKFLREKKEIEKESSTLVILMINEYGVEEGKFEFDPALTVLCEHDYCEQQKKTSSLRYLPHFVEGIRCCPFNDKINDAFFGLDLNYGDTLLQIDKLTDKEMPKKSDSTSEN